MCEWLMGKTNGATEMLQAHVLLAAVLAVGLILFALWALPWGDDEEDMKE